MRVDVLAAAAYVLGPLSGKLSVYYSTCIYRLECTQYTALLLLMLETHNDYVRFHGMPL